MLLYIHGDSCVTEVNEQRVRANTWGAPGALASWRCAALQVPLPGFLRERPWNSSAGLGVILPWTMSIACLAPQWVWSWVQEWFSVFSSFPICWAGWAWVRCHQAWVPHTYLAVFIVLAYLSSVQLPRWQTQSHQSLASAQSFVPAHEPLRFIPHMPSTEAAGASQLVRCLPFPSTCAHQPRSLPVSSPSCLSVHLHLPVPWPRAPCPLFLLLFSADPSLKACPQTASPMQLFWFPSNWGCTLPALLPTPHCVGEIYCEHLR